MIRFTKKNFFNPVISRIDPILSNSSQYDLKIEDEKKEVFYRIRASRISNTYIPKKMSKFIPCSYNSINVSPDDKEYLFLLETFFELDGKDVQKLSVDDIKKSQINFSNNFDMQNIKEVVAFNECSLLTHFKFKQTLFFERVLLDDTYVLDVIQGAYSGYTLMPYKEYKSRRYKFYKMCNLIAQKTDTPWNVVRVTINYMYYNPRYSVDFMCKILKKFKEKRSQYLSNEKLPFSDILIINCLRSQKDKEKEEGFKLILSEEEFESIKHSLYGSRNIKTLSDYILNLSDNSSL